MSSVGYAIQETLKAVKLIEWALEHEDSLDSVELLDKRRWAEVCRLVERCKLKELVTNAAWPYIMSNSPSPAVALGEGDSTFEYRANVLALSWPDRPDIVSFAMFYYPDRVYDALVMQSVRLARYAEHYVWSPAMDKYLDSLLCERHTTVVGKWDFAVRLDDDCDPDVRISDFVRSECDDDANNAQKVLSESKTEVEKAQATKARIDELYQQQTEQLLKEYTQGVKYERARWDSSGWEVFHHKASKTARALDNRMLGELELAAAGCPVLKVLGIPTSADDRYKARSFEHIASTRLESAMAKAAEAEAKLERAKGAFDREVAHWRSRAAHWIMLTKGERLAKAQAYSFDEFPFDLCCEASDSAPPSATPLPCYTRDTVLGLAFGRMFGALCEARPFLAWVTLLNTGTLRLTPFTRVYPAWAELCVARAKVVEPEIDWDAIAADWR